MSTLVSSALLSKVWNYVFIPVWLAQAAMLHPYYEPNETYRTIRLILAPIVIYLLFSSQPKRLIQPIEDYMHINYGLVAIPTFHITCCALQYAFQRGPVLKSDLEPKKKMKRARESDLTESESASATCSDSAEVIKSPQQNLSTDHNNLIENSLKSKSLKPIFFKKRRDKRGKIPSWAELSKFSLGLVFSPRCLEYTWAPPASVLSRGPKKSVAWFVLEEVVRLIGNQICLIAFAIFALPATQYPGGPYAFVTEVWGVPDSAVLRYLSQYWLLGAYGAIGLHAFTIIGSFWNLVEVVWFTLTSRLLPGEWAPKPFNPTLYPTLFNDPTWRTSLTEFWGKGWHSVFRRDFMYCGAIPAAKLASPLGPTASRLAGLMGAMLMSGIMHEWGLISIVKDFDSSFRTTKFFLMIGVGIAIEAIIKQVTGYKVSGNLGRIWTFGWITLWCTLMMDAWLARGMGKAGIRTPCEVTDWSWPRFFVPLGPILPDRFLDQFKFASTI
ncbi:hypothetical protein CROQUDRAFT_652321 [Cronartium quercuum f. sp. fusiforme G11]|uniref:Wax synthase domain-containing protein n=1 Tax=Cronartium quercuum f. sp. fusiforme G11 TaxID=708437 RepID=A0A9P6TFX2_9BASI|nr:hypothetical protein CROQUDRAFT_652321 [Cronartium quercuum f. sp. fusiforme G11]